MRFTGVLGLDSWNRPVVIHFEGETAVRVFDPCEGDRLVIWDKRTRRVIFDEELHPEWYGNEWAQEGYLPFKWRILFEQAYPAEITKVC